MTFEYAADGDPMTESDPNRIRLRIQERSMRAMYESLFDSALDEERAAIVANYPMTLGGLSERCFAHCISWSPAN